VNVSYEHDGQPHTLILESLPDGAYRAEVNGRIIVFRALPVEHGGWLLESDGARVVVHTASSGSDRFAHVDGHTFALTVPDSRQRRRVSAEGGSLEAPMPGQVTAVLASEGETVSAGQTLVILEAMKMEIRAAAPGDGVVRRVLVAEGDVVDRGQLLVEFGAE
jgi:biotin carboxyl carrier protein